MSFLSNALPQCEQVTLIFINTVKSKCDHRWLYRRFAFATGRNVNKNLMRTHRVVKKNAVKQNLPISELLDLTQITPHTPSFKLTLKWVYLNRVLWRTSQENSDGSVVWPPLSRSATWCKAVIDEIYFNMCRHCLFRQCYFWSRSRPLPAGNGKQRAEWGWGEGGGWRARKTISLLSHKRILDGFISNPLLVADTDQ